MMTPMKYIGCGIAICLGIGSTSFSREPTYQFSLEKDADHDLCVHMDTVFNKFFRDMWDTPPFLRGREDYSEKSKYAYPRLDGIPHISRAVFLLRYAKWPESPEFAAIPWIQGRLAPVKRAESQMPQQATRLEQTLALQRFLIAHVDIDNDGVVDTLIKWHATPDYSYLVHRKSSPFSESVNVIKGQRFDWPDQWSKEEYFLRFPRDEIFELEGSFVRPFSVQGRTFVARYNLDRGIDDYLVRNPPYKPMESMSVVEVSFPRKSTGEWFPRLDQRVLCEFTMNQQ